MNNTHSISPLHAYHHIIKLHLYEEIHILVYYITFSY